MRINICIIFLVVLFVSTDALAQRKKKDTKTVKISSSINYRPSESSYGSTESFGTGSRVLNIQRPQQRIGIGFSYQIIKNNTSYKELSINQISYSDHEKIRFIEDMEGNRTSLDLGENIKTFTFSMRYEVGKYFGSINNNKFNFGIGLGLQTGYNYYKEVPFTFTAYSIIVAHIVDLNLLAPLSMIKNLSKSVSIELKILPSINFNPYSSFRARNPNISLNQQQQNRIDKFPTFKTGAALHLRYLISDSSKRGRRR